MFYYDWTYLLIIPGLILGLWAQFKVKNTYAEYSRIPTRRPAPPQRQQQGAHRPRQRSAD